MSTVPNDGGTVPEHTASFVLQGVRRNRLTHIEAELGPICRCGSTGAGSAQQRIVPTV